MPASHLILYVADQARSAAFYAAVLGRAPRLDVPGMTEFDLPGGAVLGLMPEAGIRRLLGDRLPDPASAGGAPRAELYLVTDDADAGHARALAAGATELSPPAARDWGDRVGYALDPDGHVLAFAARIAVGGAVVDAPDPWLAAAVAMLASYRRLIDGAVAQLDDAALRRRPAPGANSVATILRHLGGNLRSRWTDFRTTDGEKPDRRRDAEFEDWPGDRASLLAHFDAGWSRLEAALASITAADLAATITIRGEPHAIPEAVWRSIAHVAYHAGQILLVARAVHDGDWRWLTIAPGDSAAHDARTWGTAASRGEMGRGTEGPGA